MPFPDRPGAQRILIVTHYFAAHGGGIELVAERLIRELSSEPFSFVWAASDCDALPFLPNITLLPMRCSNVIERSVGIPWPIWSPRSFRRLRRALKNCDTLWLHDTLYPGNMLAFAMAKELGKPVVITQHIGPIPYRNPLFRIMMERADRTLTRPMLKNADRVVFISDRIAEDYNQRVAFTRPVTIVPNGVDVRVFQPPLPEKRRWLRQSFALRADQPVFLFVGRFVSKKGLDVLARLAGLMPEARFWLAGRGPVNPLKWRLPNVHVFTDRTGARLAELYQSADMLLMPSYGEGFPLVVQEAMACGLPVLCSPATAAGSRLAKPWLNLAEVYPADATRTATEWAGRLKNPPVPLPLAAPMLELAEFAESAWAWPPLAATYASIFRELSAGVMLNNAAKRP